MGLDSIWHWVILLVIVLALFGTKKLTKIGPDLGNAVREFRKAVKDGDDDDKDKAESETAKNTAKESLKADPPASEATAAAGSTTQTREQHEAKS